MTVWTGKRRLTVSVLAALGSACLVGLGVILARQGLDKADKLASVMGLFIGVVGLGLSGVGLWLTFRGSDGPSSSDQSGPITQRNSGGMNVANTGTMGDTDIRGRGL